MLSVFPQANGEAGVRQTLAKMRALTIASKLDPAIRDQAALATSACDKGNKACLCASILNWTNRKIRYVADPQGVELLHDPRLMARALAVGNLVYGDCDDMSVYIASLLASIGIPTTFRAVGYDGKPLSHVYVQACGVKLDATRDAWTSSYMPHVETWAVELQV
jgi:transglutaminase-like putative cysteine protease